MRLLLLAAVTTPALAILAGNEQDPETIDWSKHVRKACESRRFGLRLAAAKRVANGGAAAVPAIIAYSAKQGLNAIPSSLVDAIADAKSVSKESTELLKGWAENNDFYWRSSAMRGLALRAGNSASQLSEDARTMWGNIFSRYVDDPAWLMRTHARFGTALIGLSNTDQTPEEDPRADVRLTRLLLDYGRLPGLQPLINALADQRTFLGIPWGPRMGQEARKALDSWLAKDFPELQPGNQAKSIAAIIQAAQKKSGQTLQTPTDLEDQQYGVIGGFEIASCKFGDQFVQWTADGELIFGIDSMRLIKLPTDKWDQLLQQRAALDLSGNQGVVICDKLQLVLLDSKVRVDIAPNSLPGPVSDWLKDLTKQIEKASKQPIAANLRRGLQQFEER